MNIIVVFLLSLFQMDLELISRWIAILLVYSAACRALQIIEYPFEWAEAKLNDRYSLHDSTHYIPCVIGIFLITIAGFSYMLASCFARIHRLLEHVKSLRLQNDYLIDTLGTCKIVFGKVKRDNKLLLTQINEQHDTLQDLQKEMLRDVAILSGLRQQSNHLEIQLKTEREFAIRHTKDRLELSNEIGRLRWYKDAYLEIAELVQGTDPTHSVDISAYVLDLEKQVVNFQNSYEELRTTFAVEKEENDQMYTLLQDELKHIKTLEEENSRQGSKLKLVKRELEMLKKGEADFPSSVRSKLDLQVTEKQLQSAQLKIAWLEKDLQKANKVVEKQNHAKDTFLAIGFQVRDHLSICQAQNAEMAQTLEDRDLQVAALFHIAEYKTLFPGLSEREWAHFMRVVRSDYPTLKQKLLNNLQERDRDDSLGSYNIQTQNVSQDFSDAPSHANFSSSGTYQQPEYDSDSSDDQLSSIKSTSRLGNYDEARHHDEDEISDPDTPQSSSSGPPYRPISPQHIDVTVSDGTEYAKMRTYGQYNSETCDFGLDAEDDLATYSF